MKFGELFEIVHAMSSGQRSNFSRFTKGKESTLPVQLYEKILQHEVLNSDSEARIRGKAFRNSNKFRNHRNTLLDWIVRSIAYYEHRPHSAEAIIRSAFQIGAIDHGKRALVDEARHLEVMENYGGLLRLYDLADEIRGLFGEQIDLPEDLIGAEEAERHLNDYRLLLEALNELKAVAKDIPEEKEKVATKFGELVKQSYSVRSNHTLAIMARVRLHANAGRYPDALANGLELLRRMKEWPEKYPVRVLAKEALLIAVLALQTGNLQLASKLAMELSILTDGLPLERAKGVLITATVAACNANESVAEAGLRDFLQMREKIDLPKQSIILHNLGMGFFYNENHPKAIECFEMLRSIPTRNRLPFQWEPFALLSISYFERGEFQLSESCLRSAQRYAKQGECLYPRLAVQTIKRYQYLPNALSKTDLSKFTLLLQDNNELRSSHNFSIDIWIEAKIHSVSASEIVHKRAKAGQLQHFGHSMTA